MAKLMRQKQNKLRDELVEEAGYLKKVKKELEVEKLEAKERKIKKGVEAAIVLKENAKHELIREERRLAELREDIRVDELKKQQELDQEARRQAEIEARAAKIGNFMGHMENTVIKKQKELDRQNEEKLRQ